MNTTKYMVEKEKKIINKVLIIKYGLIVTWIPDVTTRMP